MRSERWWARGDGAWCPPAAPPPRFLKYISKHCRFFTKEEHLAPKETGFLHENGKPCYLCYDKQNRLVIRGWRLVTIFFFFLSFSLSFFLFLLFPFISFIFFISFSLFYVFYLFYLFYLFFLYMKFLKSCIYTCLYDILTALDSENLHICIYTVYMKLNIYIYAVYEISSVYEI